MRVFLELLHLFLILTNALINRFQILLYHSLDVLKHLTDSESVYFARFLQTLNVKVTILHDLSDWLIKQSTS